MDSAAEDHGIFDLPFAGTELFNAVARRRMWVGNLQTHEGAGVARSLASSLLKVQCLLLIHTEEYAASHRNISDEERQRREHGSARGCVEHGYAKEQMWVPSGRTPPPIATIEL